MACHRLEIIIIHIGRYHNGPSWGKFWLCAHKTRYGERMRRKLSGFGGEESDRGSDKTCVASPVLSSAKLH